VTAAVHAAAAVQGQTSEAEAAAAVAKTAELKAKKLGAWGRKSKKVSETQGEGAEVKAREEAVRALTWPARGCGTGRATHKDSHSQTLKDTAPTF
jgi:hypothetical protein